MASPRALIGMALLLGLVSIAGVAVRPRASGAPDAPGAAGGLPDLIVTEMHVELETGGSCAFTSTVLGVTADIANTGGGDAGPFVVEVNGARQDAPGLAAGAEASYWFSGYRLLYEAQHAIVDVTDLVMESDETNNELLKAPPIPTLPATCTPTRTPTPTVTPTPVPPAGDANCTGIVDVRDAALILQLEAELIDALPCQEFADVSGDGAIDARDATLVLQYVAGLLSDL